MWGYCVIWVHHVIFFICPPPETMCLRGSAGVPKSATNQAVEREPLIDKAPSRNATTLGAELCLQVMRQKSTRAYVCLWCRPTPPSGKPKLSADLKTTHKTAAPKIEPVNDNVRGWFILFLPT